MPGPRPVIRDSSAETTLATVQSSQDMEADDDHTNKTKNSNTVDWADEKDESNPLNWTVGEKWRNVAVVVLMTLNTYVYQNPIPYEKHDKEHRHTFFCSVVDDRADVLMVASADSIS